MLSPREKQVTERLMRGQTHGEIASELGISLYTVRTYVSRARMRNGCKSTMELAVRYAVEQASVNR